MSGRSSRTTRARVLTAELEAALVRQLAEAWDDLNYTVFRRRMIPPLLGLSDAEGRLGRWVPEGRVIELGRAFVLRESWGVVLEVLKHEMAHQYVHEVLGLTDQTAHGPAFQELCQKLGIDARAAGAPVSLVEDSDEGRITARIAKLLALAESDNEHEAEAAMAAAQRLMLKYNLEHVAQAAATSRPSYGFRHLGSPSGRVGEAERLLGSILGRHFFVEVIFVSVYLPLEGRRGSVLEVCGSPENLEMASYVYAFLQSAAERLWVAHQRAKGIRQNRDRRSFIAGVMAGFLEKLEREKKKSEREGLVWIKDAVLDEYYRARHPRIRTLRYGGSGRTDANLEGRAAGRALELARPLGQGGGPKLLGR
jgi:hypothetical protein